MAVSRRFAGPTPVPRRGTKRLSQKAPSVSSPVPEQYACELDHAEVVGLLLGVSHEKRTAAIEPGDQSLNDPPASGTSALSIRVEFLFADPTDVGNVLRLQCCSMAGGVVVSLVEAQMLFDFIRLRPLDDNRFDRLLQQLAVRHIGAGDDDSQRATLAVAEYAALCAVLGSIRRVFAYGSPPHEPCPSRHQQPAIATRRRPLHRSDLPGAPRVHRAHRVGATFGMSGGLNDRFRTYEAAHSTGIRFGVGRSLRPAPVAGRFACGRSSSEDQAAATSAQSDTPRDHPDNARSSASVYAWT